MLKRMLSLTLSMAMVLSLAPMNIVASAEDHSAEEMTAPAVTQETLSEVTETIPVEYADRYDSSISGMATSTCGENLTWELDENGVLTVSGTGAMEDYAAASSAPWYSSRAEIRKIVVESGVTTVGDRAFYNCVSLTEVTIGPDVTTVGSYAFRGCTALKSVTIPANVAELKGSAFRACTGLTDIYCEGNAPTVGSYVFNEGAESLTVHCYEGSTGFDSAPWSDMMVVAEHVGQWILDTAPTCTTDGSRHLDCTYCGMTLTETISSSHSYVEGICSVCQEVELLASVTDSNWAWKLDVFGTLTISGSGEMGPSLWRESYSEVIKRVVIENGITNIGDSAFSGLQNMGSIAIPASVTSIASYAFKDCNLEEIYIEDMAAWLNLSLSASVANPLKVNMLEKKLYLNGELLTDVVIPEGITTIRSEAFFNCGSIKSVSIPTSVTKIGYNAFTGCTGLTDVYITDIGAWLNISFNASNPLRSSSLDKNLYLNGKLLTDVVIPEGVSNIASNAFYRCTHIESIKIPDSITEIGSYAFTGCSSLANVTLPESITKIDVYAFDGCSSLTSVVIPESVTNIQNSAFRNCSSLVSVTIPDSITEIEDYAFYSCSSLTSIRIPDSVTNIGSNAFYDCRSLESIVIPDGVTEIRYMVFGGCSSLTSIQLPDSVTSLGRYAFSGCSSLTNFVLPDSLTTIEYHAFMGCKSLTSLVFPASLTKIGENAFASCTGLKNITFMGDAPQLAGGLFNNVTLTAYYPAGNDTWTSDVRQNYGGTVTWVPYYCQEEHTEVIDEGIAATCTTDGKTEGKHCSLCGTVLVPQEIIAAKGHTEVTDSAVEATCTTDGKTEGKHCSVCNEILMAQTVITAPGHAIQEVSAVAPTVSAGGNIAHYICETCEKRFADQEGAEELSAEDVFLEKLSIGAEIDGIHYNTVPDAIAAAKPGDVVILTADAVLEENLFIPAGITLDLNGHALTAEYVAAFNGTHIVDNSKDNTGVLIVNPDHMMISSRNAHLPVWTGEGFIFIDILNFQEMYSENAAGQTQYIFSPTFESIAHPYLTQGMASSRVRIAIRMSWEIETGSAFQNFVFNDETVKAIIESFNGSWYGRAFSATITSSKLSDFDMQVVLISDTGVELVLPKQ